MKTRIAMMFLMMLLAITPLIAQSADVLYQQGNEALDEGQWRQAADKFRQAASLHRDNADAALHWLAYAQYKMGQRSDALATLVDLQKRFPRSKWAADGKALEVEIRQSAGQAVAPERVDDEDLKLIVVNGLMHTDPEKAIPILEKILRSDHSPKIKDKALFVLSQSGSPRALEVLGRVARDGSQPEMQRRALKNLGIVGGDHSRKLLADVYSSTKDKEVKRTILKSYMISGDRARLLALAKSEADADLRSDAVKQLGITGAKNELAELYATEASINVKEQIIKAMFLGGNADKLAELARSEKVLALRLAAIKNLSLIGGDKSSQFLLGMYETDTDPQVRKAVIRGLFLQSNAKALIRLARNEKDPVMKRELVSRIALINSEDTQNYLLEILNE